MSRDFEPGPPIAPSRGERTTGALTAVLPRLVIGVGVLIFGTLLLLDNLDLIEAENLIRFLVPSVLLGIAVAVMAQRSFWGWFWLAAGLWTLGDALGLIEVDFWDVVFPAALVVTGILLVSRAFRAPAPPAVERTPSDSVVNAFAFMSGNERRIDAQEFRGGNLGAVMGGVELDLRGARLAPEGAVIDAFTVWGAIELRVPQDWRVISEVVPLLGAFEDKTRPPVDPTALRGRLLIRGAAIMAGIEVSN